MCMGFIRDNVIYSDNLLSVYETFEQNFILLFTLEYKIPTGVHKLLHFKVLSLTAF